MGNCRETIAELDAFLDGELSEEMRLHLHSHLQGCHDCYSAFDFQAELKAAIRRKCSEEPVPPSLLRKIQACFEPGADGPLADPAPAD